MNDEHVIALMRAAAADGREGTAADVATAVVAGRRIRRRRRVVAATGSGALAAVAVLGVPAVVPGPFGGPADRSVVVQPADGGPASEPSGSPQNLVVELERPYGGDSVSRESNVNLLLEVLGADWRRQGMEQAVEVVPGSSAARSLPDAYGTTVRMETFASGLDAQCLADEDEGSRAAACVARTTPDGRVVQLQQRRADLAAAADAWDSTAAYYERADGSFARVEFAVHDTAELASPARQAAAVTWLEKQQDIIAVLAADPRVQPSLDGTPPVAGPRLTPGQQALLAALGPDFVVRSGGIYFEGSSKEQLAELGFPLVHATIGTVSRSAFQAACDARAGLSPCDRRTVPAGRTARTRTWVDYDTAAQALRGESAAYVEQPGGEVVLAALMLTADQVTAADAQRYEAAVLAWFGSLEDSLVEAATDGQVAAGTD